jgi:Leucine-rich repeat (LRR) protein
LAIDNRDLDGKLKIEGFSNLETIECFGNKLTSLEIRNCPKLTKICCHQNKLVKLEIKDCPMITYLNVSCNLFKNLEFIDGLDPEKLTFLSVHTNDLRQVNNNDKSGNLSLEVFRNFINLEELYIDNYDKEKFDKGTYNHFSGSLEPLKDLKDLRLLNISGTDINSGLEYLSESIKKIGCNDNGLGRECSKIRKVLEDAAKSNGITEELEGFEEGDTK